MLKNHPKQFLRATLLRNLDVSHRNRWRLSRLLLGFVSQPVSIASHSFTRPRLTDNPPRLPRLALSFQPTLYKEAEVTWLQPYLTEDADYAP